MAIQSTIGVRALKHDWNIEEISRLPVVERPPTVNGR